MKRDNHNLKNNKDSPYIDMKNLDELVNGISINDNSDKNLALIKRYLEKLILIIERSRIREYMILTDSKRRLFFINFVAGLGKGFGQAIGFTLLAAIVFYFLYGWIKLPIIGQYIATLLDIVQNYRNQ